MVAFMQLLIFIGGGTAAATVATSTTSCNNDNDNTNVDDIIKVYDNVLSETTANWLHQYSVQEYERSQQQKTTGVTGKGGRQFVFPLPTTATATATQKEEGLEEALLVDNERGIEIDDDDDDDDVGPLIHTLNDIIHEMLKVSSYHYLPQDSNSTTNAADTDTDETITQKTTTAMEPMYYVEFWTRQSWQHILAHQDMDEGQYHRQKEEEESHQQRQKHQRQQQERQGSGGSGRSLLHPEYGHVLYLQKGSSVIGPTVVFNTTTGGSFLKKDDTASSTTTTMVTVPVVTGRLLQFKGDLLHSVPRPYHVYWTLQQEYPPITKPDDVYGRSVILFNLWPYSQGPVTDKHVVRVDDAKNNSGGGLIGVDGDDDDDSGTDNRRTTSRDDNGDSIHRTTALLCNPSSSWEKVQVVSYNTGVNEQQQQQQHTSQGQGQESISTTTTTPSLSTLSSRLWSLLFPTTSSSRSNDLQQQQQQQFQIPLIGDEHRRGTTKYSIHLQTSTKSTTTKERGEETEGGEEKTEGGHGGRLLEEIFQQEHQVSTIQVEPVNRKRKSKTWFGFEL